MTVARDLTQLCFSSILAGIVANKIEQSFYTVYSYSGIESTKCAITRLFGNKYKENDHTQQYIRDEKQNSPSLFTRKL